MKTLNLIYLNTFCHQICQCGGLLRVTPTLKVTWPFNHLVLWFWFSLIRFVALERKRLSRHWLLVLVCCDLIFYQIYIIIISGYCHFRFNFCFYKICFNIGKKDKIDILIFHGITKRKHFSAIFRQRSL